MKRLLFAVLLHPGAPSAASKSATMQVTFEVKESCLITASPQPKVDCQISRGKAARVLQQQDAWVVYF